MECCYISKYQGEEGADEGEREKKALWIREVEASIPEIKF